MPQGGLEVPCILTFSTPQAYESEKTKKLVESSLALPVKLTTNTEGDKIAVSPEMLCSTNTSCSIMTSSATFTDVLESDINDVLESDINDEFKPLKKKQKLHDSEIECMGLNYQICT